MPPTLPCPTPASSLRGRRSGQLCGHTPRTVHLAGWAPSLGTQHFLVGPGCWSHRARHPGHPIAHANPRARKMTWGHRTHCTGGPRGEGAGHILQRTPPTSARSQRGSARLTAARPGKSERRSCQHRLCRNPGRRRAQEDPGGCQGGRSREAARSWRPPPAPLPRFRPSWAGSGQLPGAGGRRDGARAHRKPAPAGALRAPAAARLLPVGRGRPAAGTCALAANSRGSGAAGTAGGRGGGKEGGPEWGPRRRPELGAGIRAGPGGVGRGGVGPGASRRKLAAISGQEVSGRWASLLVPISDSLFSQSFRTQPH